ncbi:MAG: hypothetical protein AB7F23_00375 [Phycisphaerae bacterium]
MNLNFYANMLASATKRAAVWLLAAGLALIGLCALIFIFKIVFIIIAIALIASAGFWCIGMSVRMFLSLSGKNRISDRDDPYRENVRIHHRDWS